MLQTPVAEIRQRVVDAHKALHEYVVRNIPLSNVVTGGAGQWVLREDTLFCKPGGLHVLADYPPKCFWEPDPFRYKTNSVLQQCLGEVPYAFLDLVMVSATKKNKDVKQDELRRLAVRDGALVDLWLKAAVLRLAWDCVSGTPLPIAYVSGAVAHAAFQHARTRHSVDVVGMGDSFVVFQFEWMRFAVFDGTHVSKGIVGYGTSAQVVEVRFQLRAARALSVIVRKRKSFAVTDLDDLNQRVKQATNAAVSGVDV